MQVLAVKARFKQATPEEIAELTALRRSRGIKLLPTRDTNGFRRQIIALAPNGALISLHNGDGRVMWRRALGAGLDPNGDPAAAYNYSAVLPWRPAAAAHDPAAEHALVLGKAVQVDPMKPKLKPPGTKRLKLKYDGLLSKFGFKLNLRRYSSARRRPPPRPAEPRRAPWWSTCTRAPW